MNSRVQSRKFIACVTSSFGLILLITLSVVLGMRYLGKENVPTSSGRGLLVQEKVDDGAFVTRSGSSLFLGGNRFRFSGANIYWLGLQEVADGIAYPSHFQVDDALATAEFMGASVVRSHTLGISVGCSLCVEPTLGRFNQVALRHIDYAIESAREHHIKLIIPLTDNWHYYHGGKHTFIDWRGYSDENQFYANPQVIEDFEQYVGVLLNHVNSYTGIAYKNDPTILAWETGNELSAPFEWVQMIARYIKSIDHHHLVMDGNYEQANESSNFQQDLGIGAVDLYTGHYYPPTTSAFERQVKQVYNAGKVFIVGEYDWNAGDENALGRFLLAIEKSVAAGDLYWMLFPHNDSHGFVLHKEHFTLHYPGDTPDGQSRIALLLAHSYAMRGLPLPTATPPGTPQITSVIGNAVEWRGAAGADTYTIERSTEGADGPWIIVCDRCATDNESPWIDRSKPTGLLWYRVRGYTIFGVAGPYSNVYWSVG